MLVKQLLDIRTGMRDNPKMYRSTDKHDIGAQDIADLAAYLEALPIPPDYGRGPGNELDRGRTLYEKDCQGCHGKYGEGDKEKFYPNVAGQHFAYMARQITEVPRSAGGEMPIRTW